MKQLSIFFFLATVFYYKANGQFVPGVEWERCLPDATVRSAVNLSDSIFTVAFDLKSCNDSSAVGLRSYNSDGNLLWEKIFTPIVSESYHVSSLTKTADNGYIFAGSKDSLTSDFHWLVKTDSTGNQQWEKQIFFSDSEKTVFGKVIQTADGTFLFVTDKYSSSLRDVYVMKFDANGNVMWENSFVGSRFEYVRDVVTTDDGGFLIAANSNSSDGDFSGNSGTNDIWLLKIDESGNIQLKKRYGGMFNDEVCSVLKLDDGYLIGGMSESGDGDVTEHHGSNSYYDAWVFRVDVNGILIWDKSFGGKNDDYTSQMIALSNGNFLLTGSSYSTDGNIADHHLNSNYDDQWTIKISPTGDLLWAKSTGGSRDDWSNCITALDSDNVIIAGASIADDGDHHEACFTNDCRPIEGGWIVKLNEHCPSYPTAQFSFSQDGKNFSFTNESYNASSYFWSFGDGNTSTEIDPTHAYTLNGEYTICLTSSDTCSSKTFCTTISTCTSLPVASFIVSYSDGTTVEFTDASANAAQWVWDFGDGNSDNTQNPIHMYSQNGAYNVTLTVYDSCNNVSSITQEINTCNGFAADFSFTVNSNSISFSDSTTGLPISWNWNFGDGDSSQLENPFHTYTTGGIYIVCLTVAEDGCSPQTICKTISICNPATIDSFTYSAIINEVSFFDNSENDSAWVWNFGDGYFSIEQNPQHTFAQAGNYTVCEVISNDCNSDSICQVVHVECSQVQSSFGFTANNLDVTFTDQSLNATLWQWDFGDGNFSAQQNPSHTYSQEGTYHTCLVASDSCSSDTLCEDVIVQCPPFVAAFTFLQSNDTIWFTDESTNAIEWQWSFGDGNFSSEQNPVHIYDTTGTFLPCLISYDGCSFDTLCDSVQMIPLIVSSANPETFSLLISPNPFHEEAFAIFFINHSSFVTIVLYDVSGKVVRKIFEGKVSEGTHSIEFHSQNLSAGTYLLESKSEREFVVKKLIVE